MKERDNISVFLEYFSKHINNFLQKDNFDLQDKDRNTAISLVKWTMAQYEQNVAALSSIKATISVYLLKISAPLREAATYAENKDRLQAVISIRKEIGDIFNSYFQNKESPVVRRRDRDTKRVDVEEVIVPKWEYKPSYSCLSWNELTFFDSSPLIINQASSMEQQMDQEDEINSIFADRFGTFV